MGYVWSFLTNSASINWKIIVSDSTGNKLFAGAGSGGSLYTSTDSGVNWIDRGGSAFWTDGDSSADGTKLLAVSGDTNSGVVYLSSNSGANWTNLNIAAHWRGAAMTSNGQRMIIASQSGSQSGIHASTDGGSTWVRCTVGDVTFPGAFTAVGMNSTGSKVIVAANSGYLYSADISAGLPRYTFQWTKLTNSGSRTWAGIALSDDGQFIVASSHGYIYTSTNGGTTWIARTSAGSKYWGKISCNSTGSIITVGETLNNINYLYTSTDYGASWSQDTNLGISGTSFGWYKTDSNSSGLQLFAAGSGGASNPKQLATASFGDTTLPSPGSSGTLSYSNISSSGLTVNWGVASDDITSQANLQYLVYRSTSNNLDTVANIKTNGTAIGEYTANITSKEIINLLSDTTYYFNVIVKDEAGNEACYTSSSQTTLSGIITTIDSTNNIIPAGQTKTWGDGVNLTINASALVQAGGTLILDIPSIEALEGSRSITIEGNATIIVNGKSTSPRPGSQIKIKPSPAVP